MLKKCLHRVVSEKLDSSKREDFQQKEHNHQKGLREQTDNVVLFLISSSLMKFSVTKFKLR